jgi:hypothetical protein
MTRTNASSLGTNVRTIGATPRKLCLLSSLVLAALAALPAQAEPLFAWEYPVQVPGGAAAFKLALTEELYGSLLSPEFRDLQVVDPGGQPLPWRLRPGLVRRAPDSTWRSVPAYPIPVGALANGDESIRMLVQGQDIRIELSQGSLAALSPADRVQALETAWILDLRDPADSTATCVNQLRLQWGDAVPPLRNWTLAYSDNLADWSYQGDQPLGLLQHQGNRLLRDRLEVQGCPHYVRLTPGERIAAAEASGTDGSTPSATSGAPSLRTEGSATSDTSGAEARDADSAPIFSALVVQRTAGPHSAYGSDEASGVLRAQPTLARAEADRWLFGPVGPLPVSRVELRLPEGSWLRYRLSTAPDSAGPWSPLAEAEAYRLNQRGVTLSSNPLDLSPSRGRWWKLERLSAPALLPGIPELLLMARPDTLEVVAPGLPEVRVQCGSLALADSVGLVRPPYPQQNRLEYPLAWLGNRTELAGPIALQPPSGLPLRVVLWALLGLVLAGLALMARKLIGELKRDPQ